MNATVTFNKKEKINIITSTSSIKVYDILNIEHILNCPKKNSVSYFNDYVPTYVYVLIGRNQGN